MDHRNTLRAAALGLSIVLASATARAGSGNVVWSNSNADDGRLVRAMGLGNYGTQVLAAYEGANGFLRLYSGADQSPASSVWQTSPTWLLSDARVAAAKRADRMAVISRETPASGATPVAKVRGYHSSAPGMLWEYTPAVSAGANLSFGVDISHDGGRVVAWTYVSGGTTAQVHVLDGANGALLRSVTLLTSNAPIGSVLSADGRHFALTAGHYEYAVDTTTGALLCQMMVSAAVEGPPALAEDAAALACARNNGVVQAYHLQNGEFWQWFQHPSGSPDQRFSRVALSSDARWLACGSHNVAAPGSTRVQILDLATSNHAIVHELVLAAAPVDCRITDLEFSPDGHELLVATAGGASVPEELCLSDAGGAWHTSFQRDVETGISALDHSGVPGRFAALARGYSWTDGTLHARLELLEGTPSALWLASVPAAGAPLELRENAPPGTGARLLASTQLLAAPLVFPGVGSLYLPQGTIVVAANGTADASGTIAFSVPTVGWPIGATWNFQALQRNPRQLSAGFCHVTLLP